MRKRKIGILLLTLLIILVGCSEEEAVQEEKALIGKGDLLDKADLALEKGSLDEAEKLYLDSLEEEKSERAYLGLSSLYQERFAYDKEEKILDQALEVFPKSRELAIRRYEFMAFMDDLDPAQEGLWKLLEESYDEGALEALLRILLKSYDREQISILYDEYGDKIESFENKLLFAQYFLYQDQEIYRSLEDELLESADPRIYDELLKNYSPHDGEERVRIQELISKGKELDPKPVLLSAYEFILENDDISYSNIDYGRFIEPDRYDAGLVYEKDYSLYIKIFNGLTGEEIDLGPDGEYYGEYPRISRLEKSRDRDLLTIIYVNGTSASSPPGLLIFDYEDGSFEELDFTMDNDLEFKLKDDFSIHISSASFPDSYHIDIDMEDRLGFIESGYYSPEGIVRNEDDTLIYHDGYELRARGDKKDTFTVLKGFGGSHRFEAERTGYLVEYYNYIDDGLKLSHYHLIGLDKDQDEDREEMPRLGYFTDYLQEEDFKLYKDGRSFYVDDYIYDIFSVLAEGDIEVQDVFSDEVYSFRYRPEGNDILFLSKQINYETYEYINIVHEVNKPGIKNSRGLEVGMTREDLESIYPLDIIIEEDENEWVYMVGEMIDHSFNDMKMMDLYLRIDKKTNKLLSYTFESSV